MTEILFYAVPFLIGSVIGFEVGEHYMHKQLTKYYELKWKEWKKQK